MTPMSSDLRWYVVSWRTDGLAHVRGLRDDGWRRILIRTADMKDAITLFEKEGEELSNYTWKAGEKYKIRAVLRDDCQHCCGCGKGPTADLLPAETCQACGGTGKTRVN